MLFAAVSISFKHSNRIACGKHLQAMRGERSEDFREGRNNQAAGTHSTCRFPDQNLFRVLPCCYTLVWNDHERYCVSALAHFASVAVET